MNFGQLLLKLKNKSTFLVIAPGLLDFIQAKTLPLEAPYVPIAYRSHYNK